MSRAVPKFPGERDWRVLREAEEKLAKSARLRAYLASIITPDGLAKAAPKKLRKKSGRK